MHNGLSQGPLKESSIVAPAQFIAFGDLPDVHNKTLISFNANLDPTDTTFGHSQCPCNRHMFLTDLLFADGHAEHPKRNDVRNPNNGYWRSRWNNDNNAHMKDVPSWAAVTPWLNTLDQ